MNDRELMSSQSRSGGEGGIHTDGYELLHNPDPGVGSSEVSAKNTRKTIGARTIAAMTHSVASPATQSQILSGNGALMYGGESVLGIGAFGLGATADGNLAAPSVIVVLGSGVCRTSYSRLLPDSVSCRRIVGVSLIGLETVWLSPARQSGCVRNDVSLSHGTPVELSTRLPQRQQ